jgi:hypothetical protein
LERALEKGTLGGEPGRHDGKKHRKNKKNKPKKYEPLHY